jgi:hypothetical protein
MLLDLRIPCFPILPPSRSHLFPISVCFAACAVGAVALLAVHTDAVLLGGAVDGLGGGAVGGAAT